MQETLGLSHDCVRSIQQQEVPAICNRHHLSGWDPAVIALAFFEC